MARPAYLADTSVLARLTKRPVLEALAPLTTTHRVALCLPVLFEVGYSTRSADDHRLLIGERLAMFPMVPTNDADHQRALDVQRLLAETGRHRAVSLVDALVAAVAEARDLTVLHYDADFELIASVTGQPHRWIVERGTAD